MEWLTWDGVDCEFEMMSGDGACDVGGERKDSIDCFRGCSVLEDYTEFGKGVGDFGQVSEKMFFGVKDGDVLVISITLGTVARLHERSTRRGRTFS